MFRDYPPATSLSGSLASDSFLYNFAVSIAGACEWAHTQTTDKRPFFSLIQGMESIRRFHYSFVLFNVVPNHIITMKTIPLQ